MHSTRRTLLAAALAVAFAGPAGAQDPKTITFVVPAPAGGGLDAIARLVADSMARKTGQQVVVENRAGANTNIGMDYVARSAPDGHTVLITGVSLAINDLMFKMQFTPLKELRPVVQISDEYAVLAVPAASPVRSVSDLHALANKKPGGVNCGAPPGHMLLACGQLGEAMPSTTIPFPGVAPAVNATLGGHVDALFVSPESSVRPHVEAGKLRILAVDDRLRQSPGLRFYPGFRQVWPGFTATSFSGAWVPAATPKAVVDKLNRDFNAVLSDPEVIERMAAANQPVVGGTAEAFGAHAAKAREGFQGVITRLKMLPQ
jgi:tripartite-type tricarboxylate transporter receptor subunit TctC